MGYIFHLELSKTKKQLAQYNKHGSVHYRAKQFTKATKQFSAALELAKLCHIENEKELVQCYYNLGAAYHQKKELSKANDALLIAQNLGQNKTEMESLLDKISNR